MTTKTIAVANQKGGVGKTTTVASLGAALAEKGQRVLLVDLDPQGGLTFSVGIDPEDIDITVGEVLLGKAAPDDAIVITDDGMHLLPSNITVTQAEETLISRTGASSGCASRSTRSPMTTTGSWSTARPRWVSSRWLRCRRPHEVLIPLQAETLSHRGVGQLLDTIHDVKQFINSELVILGVLPTMYDGRTNHARAVIQAIEESYELRILQPPIPKTIRFAEAPAIGRSILGTSKNHKGAEAYRQVAASLLNGHHA